jgi:hypothetical protein
MRRLLTAIASLMLCLCAFACGESDKTAAPERRPARSAARAPQTIAALRHRTTGPYLNDGDHENPHDPDGDHLEDNDGDSRIHENTRYHDADDDSFAGFGKPAATSDFRQVRATVERYYATAASDDGARACAELIPRIAAALPADYGGGESSGRDAAKTCGEVLAKLLEKSRRDFSSPVEVTDVRLDGNEGFALLGSRAAPASSIAVARENGIWGVAQVLPQRLD